MVLLLRCLLMASLCCLALPSQSAVQAIVKPLEPLEAREQQASHQKINQERRHEFKLKKRFNHWMLKRKLRIQEVGAQVSKMLEYRKSDTESGGGSGWVFLAILGGLALILVLTGVIAFDGTLLGVLAVAVLLMLFLV